MPQITTVSLLLVLLSASIPTASVSVRGVEFEVSRNTTDSGGIMQSSGGDFELSGTIGQPDAGSMAGSGFELTSGFWFDLLPGDCNSTGRVDLLDYDDFEACLTGSAVGVTGGCECFDVNRSDAVDLLDFAVARATFTGS